MEGPDGRIRIHLDVDVRITDADQLRSIGALMGVNFEGEPVVEVPTVESLVIQALLNRLETFPQPNDGITYRGCGASIIDYDSEKGEWVGYEVGTLPGKIPE